MAGIKMGKEKFESEKMTGNQIVRALGYAFPKTVPVMVGYLFLGAAYGILMSVNGFGIGWAFLMSLFVYAGSLQYVGIDLLVSAAGPLTAFVMALMINARHLFYGISMLGKYREMRKGKSYLIFGLTDETFSIVCGIQTPEGISQRWACLWMTALDQLYWIAGTLLGAAAGSAVSFNTKGLDFALTALFIMIFTEQWLSQKRHSPAVTGVACSLLCLLVFGQKMFIIPAMLLILLVVSMGCGRGKKEAQAGGGE